MTEGDLKDIWQEVDEALSPTNVLDGDYKKCLDVTTCIDGGDKGEPVFVFEAKSPRTAVNDLAMSVYWSTDSRAEAAAFLRQLASKIEEGT